MEDVFPKIIEEKISGHSRDALDESVKSIL
jgi:hypothetical protein